MPGWSSTCRPARFLLLGDNAQGKTSLLEAIYYLATSRSPHTTSPRQLINWLAGQESLTPAARIVAHVTRRQAAHTLDVTLMLEPAADGEERFRKQIKMDGIPRRAHELVGQVTVVMFLPQDVDLVGGSPSLRRRYLDAALEPGGRRISWRAFAIRGGACRSATRSSSSWPSAAATRTS